MRSADKPKEGARTRLLLTDVLSLALGGLLSRPGRSALTTLGTVLGVGMLVVILGLTSSAHAEINDRFDSLDSTEIQVQAADGATGSAISDLAGEQAARLHGVVSAGVIRTQLNPEPTVTLSPTPAGEDSPQDAGTSPDVMGASPSALGAIGAHLGSGLPFNATEEADHAHVALLGVAAIQQLGLSKVPAIVYLDGVPFLAQGIISSSSGDDDALVDVVIPASTAEVLDDNGRTSEIATLVVRTRLGYTPSVGNTIAATIDPVSPTSLTVITPPSPTALGAEISSDVTVLFIVLGGVSLIVGVVGIANTTLVSVLERVGEIGLRRAVGARKGQIALQFVCESVTLGTLGGIFGASLGIIAVVAVAAGNGWTPVMTPYVVAIGPLVGGLAGLLAGVYPAYHAASIDPLIALGR